MKKENTPAPSKKQIKADLKDKGHLLCEMLDQCGMALVKGQDYRGNGKVHTMRAYGDFDYAQKAIKKTRDSRKKKIANALFEIIKDSRKSANYEECKYFTIEATGEGFKIGFKYSKPQAMIDHAKAQAETEESKAA